MSLMELLLCVCVFLLLAIDFFHSFEISNLHHAVSGIKIYTGVLLYSLMLGFWWLFYPRDRSLHQANRSANRTNRNLHSISILFCFHSLNLLRHFHSLWSCIFSLSLYVCTSRAIALVYAHRFEMWNRKISNRNNSSHSSSSSSRAIKTHGTVLCCLHDTAYILEHRKQ